MECFPVCCCANNECNERAKYPFISKLNTIYTCISEFPNILEDMINLEWFDLYANKLSNCPTWDKNPNMKFMDFEQNLFLMNNEIYNKLLENLRKSTDPEKRLMGAVCIDSNLTGSNDIDFYESSSSSYEESTFSSDSHPDSHDDQSTEHLCVQLKEDVWEENTYEITSALFDPKEFEMELFNELSKLQLSAKEGVTIKSPKKSSSYLGNEHYFCPSDDYSKIL
ncbi:uncharacterized protein LOC126834456 isoform X3 [Adelges cooleyi]|uniref:uncharacterized protein LOC126834456 isoform X3 n=1 Tax=Adelges cooleyi TaxID=133065 RepID=UPI002180440F|nr:uncharacterized protein LOC126834456 isoform X3 [Adelges cooleyi]